MSYKLNGRITRLEEQLNPPDSGRILLVNTHYGEDEADAIARAAFEPDPRDLIVYLVQYGEES